MAHPILRATIKRRDPTTFFGSSPSLERWLRWQIGAKAAGSRSKTAGAHQVKAAGAKAAGARYFCSFCHHENQALELNGPAQEVLDPTHLDPYGLPVLSF